MIDWFHVVNLLSIEFVFVFVFFLFEIRDERIFVVQMWRRRSRLRIVARKNVEWLHTIAVGERERDSMFMRRWQMTNSEFRMNFSWCLPDTSTRRAIARTFFCLFASVLATSEHRIDNEHRFRFEEVQVRANVRSKPNYKLYIFHVHSDERLLWRSAQRFEN